MVQFDSYIGPTPSDEMVPIASFSTLGLHQVPMQCSRDICCLPLDHRLTDMLFGPLLPFEHVANVARSECPQKRLLEVVRLTPMAILPLNQYHHLSTIVRHPLATTMSQNKHQHSCLLSLQWIHPLSNMVATPFITTTTFTHCPSNTAMPFVLQSHTLSFPHSLP